MIKILKQRFMNGKSPMINFAPRIEARSVMDLFLNIEEYVALIPESERFNCHYTLGETGFDDTGKKEWLRQNVFPFDIDEMDTSRIDEYVDIFLNTLGLNKQDVGIVSSGRGLHFLIGTTDAWDNKAYFKANQEFYKRICDKVTVKLIERGLRVKMDTLVFAPNRTLRLPGTKNIKTIETGHNKDFTGDCVLINRTINPIPSLTLASLAGLNDDKDYEEVPIHRGKSMLPVDTDGVLSQCLFIKWCGTHQEKVNYAQWFAMTSVVSFLESGEELVHKLSCEHPEYDVDKTQALINNVLSFGKARTCSSIATVTDLCNKCPWQGKCNTPLSIKTESFIPTLKTGFRKVKVDIKGNLTHGQPELHDLLKYLRQKYLLLTDEGGTIWYYSTSYWKQTSPTLIEKFAHDNINPIPTSHVRTEFRKLVTVETSMSMSQEFLEHIDKDFFETSVAGKLNLSNGVLDISGDSPILKPHSPEYGFQYQLSYAYNAEAKAPNWEKFIKDITLEREDLALILQEFMGYCFGNGDNSFGKCLLLLGEGANGKSTFMESIADLAGKDAYSVMKMDKINNETSLINLRGKLFNFAEETPKRALEDSANFKDAVTGGTLEGRYLYQKSVSFKCKTKFVFASNELPQVRDATRGFIRRFIIVPFDAVFSKEEGNVDYNIKAKLKEEKSGILNWIIEGYQRLYKQGGFTESIHVDKEIETFKDEINPASGFVRDCLIVDTWKEVDCSEAKGYDKYTKFSRLYTHYVEYCRETGVKYPVARNKLRTALRPYIKDIDRRVQRLGHHGEYYALGIKLIDTSDF